ncbi:MAG: hypothetical protein ACE5JZ_03060 [Kiloniellales bacterium]
MVAWPATLPAEPLAVAVSEGFDDSLILTEMDAGPTKRRRRYTARADRLEVTYRMTPTELTNFRTFYGTTTNDGLTTYTMTHPITGNTVTVGIMAPPAIRMVGGGQAYDVSLKLEIQP